MKTVDTISGTVLLALSVAALFEITNLPIGSLTSPQAGFFPLLLAVFLGILSVVLLGQAMKETDKGKGNFWGSREGRKRIGLTLGGLFAVAIFFEILGYLISAFLLIFYLLVVIGNQKWWVAGITAFSSALISYLLFGLLLRGSLPTGIWA